MGFRAFLVIAIEVTRQAMAGNSRKWQKIEVRLKKTTFAKKMAGNGFPRVSRRGHRGDQAGNGRKWLKMAKKGFPRLFGRKWISAYFMSFPYYYGSLVNIVEIC